MKSKLLIFAIILLTSSASILAQQENAKKSISLGINTAFYKQNPLGLEAKWIREKKPSFMLRLNYFNIDNKTYEVEPITPQTLSHKLTMQGVTFKPGIILLQHGDKNTYLYLGVLGIVTASKHNLNFTYNDVFGVSEQVYMQNHINYGAELDFGGDISLVSKFYLGLQVKMGVKQTEANLFNNYVNGHNSYYQYTPTQGYGAGSFYINFGLSIGILL